MYSKILVTKILKYFIYRMSCKEKNASRSKHYTPIERKVFLQILHNYKHVIERKKSDGTTLREKDVAWSEICNHYNQSSLISQEVRIINKNYK